MTDDLTIRRDTLDALLREIGPAAAGVGVIVDRGVVRLAGFLHAIDARQGAQRAAHAVAGVRAVVDDLTVRDAGFPEHDGGAVAQAALEALAAAPGVPREGIQLTVYKGNVTLRGSAVDARHAEAAEAILRAVPGVFSVCRDCSVADFEALEQARPGVAHRAAGIGESPGAQAW